MLTTECADILIIGGGVGGFSAALAALRRGRTVILVEPTPWLGGQLTSQLVPSDEHRRIEHTGRNESYATFRQRLREHYRSYFPLVPRAHADPFLNPGAGWVSPVSMEPKVIVSVMHDMLRPFEASGRLRVMLEAIPLSATTEGDIVTSVEVRDRDGAVLNLTAPYILDATELGDLLSLADVEFVSGRESQSQTGEPGAASTSDPLDMQSATWCFALEHRAGEDHTIDRPANYGFFREWRPPQLLGERMLGFRRAAHHNSESRVYQLNVNPDDDPFEIDVDHRRMGATPELWNYRRISARRQFTRGAYASDITIVNWPMNDYVGGPLFGSVDAPIHWAAAKDLSVSLLYWLQTEAPRPDGGTGWPGLRTTPQITGTADGFAMVPYFRESRRIVAERTIVQQDFDRDHRNGQGAESYEDSVGVGHYYWIDRHATTGGNPGGGGLPEPFEIPLGALIPQRVQNLLPAAKNIGTTHISNGSYRLQPVEWSIGEAAGALAAFCIDRRVSPSTVRSDPTLLEDFQSDLVRGGAQLRWDPAVRW
ncbi:FAD-dependent oxidoreductase [Glaciihabitans sp. UYNi722]|uniref:FAD-dependent oxidoreductase n=1 Tax=Glaciihabitans sp. UYNi722 TaxID=3156344 RepID=UPI00339B68EB